MGANGRARRARAGELRRGISRRAAPTSSSRARARRRWRRCCPHLADGRGRCRAVPGIVFRAGDGTTVSDAAARAIGELDAQPLPDREAIDLEQYLDDLAAPPRRSARFRSSPRAAVPTPALVQPFGLWLLAPPPLARERRRRNRMICERYGRTSSGTRTTSSRSTDVAGAICRGARARRPALSVRDDHARGPAQREVVDTLAAMGCYRFWIGAESGSQRILDGMDRRTNAVRMRDMIRLVKRMASAPAPSSWSAMRARPGRTSMRPRDHLRDVAARRRADDPRLSDQGHALLQDVADRIIAPHAGRRARIAISRSRAGNSPRFYATRSAGCRRSSRSRAMRSSPPRNTRQPARHASGGSAALQECKSCGHVPDAARDGAGSMSRSAGTGFRCRRVDYDRRSRTARPAAWLREQVREQLLPFLAPGDDGARTRLRHRRGCAVARPPAAAACWRPTQSERMLDVCSGPSSTARCRSRPRASHGGRDTSCLPPGYTAGLVFSNFGALNCVGDPAAVLGASRTGCLTRADRSPSS